MQAKMVVTRDGVVREFDQYVAFGLGTFDSQEAELMAVQADIALNGLKPHQAIALAHCLVEEAEHMLRWASMHVTTIRKEGFNGKG